MIVPDISLEKSLWLEGFRNVAGVDEVGRGPLAGPVVASAVVIHNEKQVVSSVRDSKKMTRSQREKAFEEIRGKSSAFGVGIVSNGEIDALGIENATQKAMTLALSEIETNFNLTVSYVLIDGSKTKPLRNYRQKRIKSGDLYHYSISAASVLAKVTRDRMMRKFAEEYPGYGFENHVGYGTKTHLEAMHRLGICPLHRRSFAPVKNILQKY